MLPLSNLNSTITFPVRIHDQSCGIRSGRAAWCGEPQNIHLTFKFGGFFTTDFWWYWGYHWVYSTTLINIFTSAELPIQRNPACSSSANSFFPPKAVHQKPSKVERAIFICNSRNLKQKTNPKSDSSWDHYAVPPDVRASKNDKRNEIGEFGLPQIRFLWSFSCLIFLLNLSSSHNQPCQIPLSTAARAPAAPGRLMVNASSCGRPHLFLTLQWVKIGVFQKGCFPASESKTIVWKGSKLCGPPKVDPHPHGTCFWLGNSMGMTRNDFDCWTTFWYKQQLPLAVNASSNNPPLCNAQSANAMHTNTTCSSSS